MSLSISCHSNGCNTSGRACNAAVEKLEKYQEMLLEKYDKIINIIDDRRQYIELNNSAEKFTEKIRTRLKEVELKLEKQTELNSILELDKQVLARQLQFSKHIIHCFTSHFNIKIVEKNGAIKFTVGQNVRTALDAPKEGFNEALHAVENEHLRSENKLLQEELRNLRNTHVLEREKVKEVLNLTVSNLDLKLGEKCKECDELKKRLYAHQNIIKELSQNSTTLMSLLGKNALKSIKAKPLVDGRRLKKKTCSQINNNAVVDHDDETNNSKSLVFYKSSVGDLNKRLKSTQEELANLRKSYETKIVKLNEQIKFLEQNNSKLRRRLVMEKSAFKNELQAISREIDDTEKLLIKAVFFTDSHTCTDDNSVSEKFIDVLERASSVKESINMKQRNII